MKTYIIAEAGVNHNGILQKAFDLIDKAVEAKADCIKFQTFKAEKIATKTAPKASYQKRTTDKKESQFDMLKRLELSYFEFKQLFEYCKKVKIDFLSTPYNFNDVDMLNELGVDCFKIASAQLTEIPFLKYVANKMKKMIVSTGMSNLSDIWNAVQAIRETGNNEIFVLQCTTNYPSSINDANLLAMETIKRACGVRVGYSDHTLGNLACFASVALGAEIVEKHFTLDKKLSGPDHSSSFNPNEFKDLVFGIRQIEKSLGSPLKRITSDEKENIFGMKRSLFSTRDIKKGDRIQLKDIEFKRPASGLNINLIDTIIGKKAKVNISFDEPFLYSNIEW